MSCEDIMQSLSRGQPLTGLAASHVETCVGCRAMMQALAGPNGLPDSEQVDRITRLIQSSLEPVRPLPSDLLMILIGLGAFLAFSIAAALQIGPAGFYGLTPAQRLAYYAIITACAILFSALTVREMIPGSQRRMAPGVVIALSLLSVTSVAFVLFHNFNTAHFVVQGIPCLKIGCICAAISGFGAYFLVRKGLAPSPLQLSTTVGFFAGLAGVAVLALFCPRQNTAHIIVWHLGAMLAGGLGGFLAGVCRQCLFPRKLRVLS
jgi:hypothetical protein